jgi:hypothetical protein
MGEDGVRGRERGNRYEGYWGQMNGLGLSSRSDGRPTYEQGLLVGRKSSRIGRGYDD